MNNTQKTIHIEIYRDGEPDPDYEISAPRIIDTFKQAIHRKVNDITTEASIQAQTALFDFKHGTNYRRIRNKLREEQKRRNFERRIGLIPAQ